MPQQSLLTYFLHSADQYALVMNAPAWLVGAELAVVSSVIVAASLTMLKYGLARRERAQGDSLDSARTDSGRRSFDSANSFFLNEEKRQGGSSSCPSPLMIFGLVLYLLAFALQMLALVYAPETTVAPLGVIQLIVNMPLAYGVLHERFSTTDIIANVLCVGGMLAAVVAMPRNIPGHLEDFPLNRFLVLCHDMSNNYGFTVYAIGWSVLVVFCLNANWVVKSDVRKKMYAFTMPTLTGLFSSASAFLVKIVGTLYYHSDDHPEVWSHISAYVFLVSMVLSLLLTLIFVYQGVRNFDCRFFVPASFTVKSVMMILQGLLFFEEWEDMQRQRMWMFVFSIVLAVTSVFFIGVEDDTIHNPQSLGLSKSPSATNLIPVSPGTQGGETVWPNKREIAVLTIMEEHGIREPSPQLGTEYVAASNGVVATSYADVALARSQLLGSCWGRVWEICCRIHPLLLFFLLPVLCLVLFKSSYIWSSFLITTTFCAYNAWKFGLHIALYSNVGRMKVEAYSQVDFEKLFHKLADHPDTPEAMSTLRFDDVMHFVILTNYKEDLEIMKEAIMSVAVSRIADRQIALVLACEEREDGIKEKAEKLLKEVEHLFKHTIYTLHPPGIPNEVPGKSSNCRWAAQRVAEEHIPALGYDMGKVVFTVMDADSEFHSEYFSALTYHFVTASAQRRYNTIWQPPIIHFKNYHEQPAVVKLASLLTSQHELANLADISSTRLPYSTYSISGTLAMGVDGWDPDWISEDWHMCAKCFCATLGSLTITPIFLPIMNYTPEGESYWETVTARWTQAKRHALGISEVVYFAGTVPFLLSNGSYDMGRRLRLLGLGIFLWMKMLMVHLSMACTIIIPPFNGLMMSYFYRRHDIEDINTFTFLANTVIQFISATTFIFFMYTNVLLYDHVAPRITGHDDPANRACWGRRHWHYLYLILGCMPSAPVFLIMGGSAEWIAAAKTAFTHKFHYEVALKPTAAAAKVAPA
eukprot:TRINITY_DN71623_c0_g1_i1.p1 TRINITY_DN71623_c0_g1~~TRINITY_DN71623_c0_g1_i1.p1  ORF type:complete len:980 (-),score=178.42 TRINITY_DN71623_c0_g1_i1:28-2967(-)